MCGKHWLANHLPVNKAYTCTIERGVPVNSHCVKLINNILPDNFYEFSFALNSYIHDYNTGRKTNWEKPILNMN